MAKEVEQVGEAENTRNTQEIGCSAGPGHMGGGCFCWNGLLEHFVWAIEVDIRVLSKVYCCPCDVHGLWTLSLVQFLCVPLSASGHVESTLGVVCHVSSVCPQLCGT